MEQHIDDIMLTYEDVPHCRTLCRLLWNLWEEDRSINSEKIQDPGTAIKFLGAIYFGKMYIVPEALTDNVQM